MVEKGRIARTPAIEGGSKEEAEKKETKDVTGDVSGVIGGVRGGGRKRTGVRVGVGFVCEPGQRAPGLSSSHVFFSSPLVSLGQTCEVRSSVGRSERGWESSSFRQKKRGVRTNMQSSWLWK
jgi:hypothetical protein